MAKKKRREGPVYTVVAIGDVHDDPKIPKDRFRWLGRFIADVCPTHVIQIGDYLTFDSLNTHVPNETSGGRLKGTFVEDVASLNEALDHLAWHTTGIENCRWHTTLGNHERRLYSFQDKAPEVGLLMEHEFERVLVSHGWGFSEYGAEYLIDNVAFTHISLNRLGKAYGGKTCEVQIGNDALRDTVVGHTHVARIHTAPKVGGDYVRVVNLGSALPWGHTESYAKHNATGWTWGVWKLTIFDRHIQAWEFIDMRTLERKFK